MSTSAVTSLRRSRAAVLFLAAAVGPAIVAPAADAAPACCPDLSGNWDCGSWKSAGTGHSGKLRAKLTRCGANQYRCTFCGTFWKVVPFRYTVTLHVTGCRGGRVYFRASRNLPVFGGTFTCTGSATARSFRANFTSPEDSGVFMMSR